MDQRFLDAQVCTFSCSLNGCRFRRTTSLAEWLTIRTDHMAEQHPEFKPRKLHRGSIPGAKTRTFTEREMREGVAA